MARKTIRKKVIADTASACTTPILQSVMQALEKEGKFTLSYCGGQPFFADVERWYGTGCTPLDFIISGKIDGGFPGGRISEIAGEEGAGKSALLYSTLAQAQQKGIDTFLIESEGTFEEARAAAFNMDLSRLGIEWADTVEEAFAAIEAILNTIEGTGHPIVIGWDSLAGTSTEHELEGHVGTVHVSPHARLMSQAMRMFAKRLIRTNATLIIVNQLKTNVGKKFGPAMESFGGKALKFHSSVRLTVAARERLFYDKESKSFPKGIVCHVNCIKNKVSRPFFKIDFELMFDSGIDNAASIVKYLIDNELIDKVGTRYKWGERSYFSSDIIDLVRNGLDDKALALALIQEQKFPWTKTEEPTDK